MFAQARAFLDKLEEDFRARERTRESALASLESVLAEAEAAFQETVDHDSAQHKGVEAFIEMKARQLARLREDTEREVDVAKAGLDQHREEVQAQMAKLIEQRTLLDDREASAAESTVKLQRILVAALTAEKRSAGRLAAAEERYQEQLYAKAVEFQAALRKQERVTEALWEELAQNDTVKNLGAQLGEAAQREAAARGEATAIAGQLAEKEEIVVTSKERLAGMEERLMSTLRDKSIGMSRFRDATDRAATAMRQLGLVLSWLHHHDPSFPVTAVFDKIASPSERAEAETAVAAHVAELVRRMARK